MEWSGRVAALVFTRRPGGGGSVTRLPADRPPRGPGRRLLGDAPRSAGPPGTAVDDPGTAVARASAPRPAGGRSGRAGGPPEDRRPEGPGARREGGRGADRAGRMGGPSLPAPVGAAASVVAGRRGAPASLMSGSVGSLGLLSRTATDPVGEARKRGAGPVAPLAKCMGREECSCANKVRIYQMDEARRLLVPCRQRRCAHCGAAHWRAKALATYHAGIDPAREDEYLAVTLTAPGRGTDIVAWNATSQARWHNFMTILRRSYPAVEFWKVAELQQRGAVHFHVLFRGVRFMPHGKVRGIAKAVGFGPNVWIKATRDYKYGAQGGGLYFGKYLLKSFERTTGVTRLVTYSNGWRLHWVRHEKVGPSPWLFAGSMQSGWRLIGDVVEPSRYGVGRNAGVEEWYPSWWRVSWQRAKARWASSRSLWGLDDPPGEGPQSAPRGPAHDVWR